MTFGWLAGTHSIWTAADGGPPSRDTERAVAWDLFAQMRDALPLPSTSMVRATWYRQGFAADDGTYAVFYEGLGRAAGGVMATVRQSMFERLGPDGAWALVRGLAPGLHASRLDLAADGPAADLLAPAQLFDLLPAARSRSRRAGQVLTVDQAGGQKLTVGARSSGRYLRCYIKGDRIRHELELKQAAAGDALGQLLGGESIVSVWAEEYRRLIEWRW